MWPLSRLTREIDVCRGRHQTINIKYLILLITISLALVACKMEVERKMHQPIEVGPWRFTVNRSIDFIETHRGPDQYKKVIVFLTLENYMERHEKPFDDFLNGRSSSLFAVPHLKLIDQGGNKFDGHVIPESGGSMRSKKWRVEFLLMSMSMRDMFRANSSELAAEHLDKKPADFRLLIENPDRRSGQYRRILIQLE